MFYFYFYFILERDDDSASLVFVLKDVKREKKGYIKNEFACATIKFQ